MIQIIDAHADPESMIPDAAGVLQNYQDNGHSHKKI